MALVVIDSADIGANGRLVIPKKIRDAMKIKEGDTMLFENISDQEARLKVLRGEDEFLKTINASSPKRSEADRCPIQGTCLEAQPCS